MKKEKIIYWVSTGLISAMMLFSAYSYLADPKFIAVFIHLGFPAYFRIELAIMKIIGAAVLIIPLIPMRVKEWAYAGFGIVFISAPIAHYSSGDGMAMVVPPLVFMAVLILSNVYLHKLSQGK